MRKIVINNCYGGFGLSNQALVMLHERKHPGTKYFFYKEKYEQGISNYRRTTLEDADTILMEDQGDEFSYVYKSGCNKYDEITLWPMYADRVERHDPDLVAIVEQLGEAANGDYAELRIEEIPDDEKYIIQEYDGAETILLRSDIDNWNWK